MTDLLEMINPVIDLDVVFRKPSNERGGGGIPEIAWQLVDDVSVGKVKWEAARCFRCGKA